MVMPFELTNAPATFIDQMNGVCRLMLDRWVILFIDDVLVFSKTREQHEENMQELLWCVEERMNVCQVTQV